MIHCCFPAIFWQFEIGSGATPGDFENAGPGITHSWEGCQRRGKPLQTPGRGVSKD